MGIGSILSMAQTAMSAQQAAVQVASQNISNAQTPGYSRQTAELAAAVPTVFPYGSVGNGVTIQTISRARDTLLDSTYRTDAGSASAASTTSSALQQIQQIFGEPSDTGLASALSAFWSSWSDLANDPSNTAAKSVVLSDGQNVATMLNQFAGQLQSTDAQNRQAMAITVSQVNTLTSHIAQLNTQIAAAESSGNTANDLRDSRDTDLDQIAQLTGGQVVARANGSAAVYVGGRLLVDGGNANTLQLNSADPPTISIAGASGTLAGVGGTLGAQLDLSTTRIPGLMNQLDALASSLVTNVNAIHSTGTAYSGNPPVGTPAGNFFDVTNPPPSGTDPRLTAIGIRVVPGLTANDVAAASASGGGSGDNQVALAIAQLGDQAVTVAGPDGTSYGTSTMPAFYQQTIADLATATRKAQDDETVQTTLASNADTQRQSVSGVSTDDELVNIIQHQNSYQAAARIVSVVDQMMQTLVTLGQ